MTDEKETDVELRKAAVCRAVRRSWSVAVMSMDLEHSLCCEKTGYKRLFCPSSKSNYNYMQTSASQTARGWSES